MATPYAKYGLDKSAVVVKTTGGVLEGIHVGNPAAAATYIQFFDLEPTATLTVGTTAPTFVFAAATVNGGTWPQCNIAFQNGLRIAATTTATGNTDASVAANVVLTFK